MLRLRGGITESVTVVVTDSPQVGTGGVLPADYNVAIVHLHIRRALIRGNTCNASNIDT